MERELSVYVWMGWGLARFDKFIKEKTKKLIRYFRRFLIIPPGWVHLCDSSATTILLFYSIYFFQCHVATNVKPAMSRNRPFQMGQSRQFRFQTLNECYFDSYLN